LVSLAFFLASTLLPWPGAQSIETIDPANTFHGNLSGLTFASDGTLWGIRNGPGSLFHRDTSNNWAAPIDLRYPNGQGNPDTEGITIVSGQIFVCAERDNKNNNASRNSVLRYNPDSPIATMEWDLTPDLPTSKPNFGLEAITWLPDSFLTAHKFWDESKSHPYNPADYPDHGQGLFLVGLESNGTLYAYALNQTNNTYTRIAIITIGLPSIMDLFFDRELQDLYAVCDDTCEGQSALLRINPSGRFTVTHRFARPEQMPNLNNEGFAIAPLDTCRDNRRTALFADDGESGGHAIRATSLPCTRLQ